MGLRVCGCLCVRDCVVVWLCDVGACACVCCVCIVLMCVSLCECVRCV